VNKNNSIAQVNKDLVNAMTTVGKVAGKIGISMKEMAGAIAAVSNKTSLAKCDFCGRTDFIFNFKLKDKVVCKPCLSGFIEDFADEFDTFYVASQIRKED